MAVNIVDDTWQPIGTLERVGTPDVSHCEEVSFIEFIETVNQGSSTKSSNRSKKCDETKEAVKHSCKRVIKRKSSPAKNDGRKKRRGQRKNHPDVQCVAAEESNDDRSFRIQQADSNDICSDMANIKHRPSHNQGLSPPVNGQSKGKPSKHTKTTVPHPHISKQKASSGVDKILTEGKFPLVKLVKLKPKTSASVSSDMQTHTQLTDLRDNTREHVKDTLSKSVYSPLKTPTNRFPCVRLKRLNSALVKSAQCKRKALDESPEKADEVLPKKMKYNLSSADNLSMQPMLRLEKIDSGKEMTRGSKDKEICTVPTQRVSEKNDTVDMEIDLDLSASVSLDVSLLDIFDPDDFSPSPSEAGSSQNNGHHGDAGDKEEEELRGHISKICDNLDQIISDSTADDKKIPPQASSADANMQPVVKLLKMKEILHQGPNQNNQGVSDKTGPNWRHSLDCADMQPLIKLHRMKAVLRQDGQSVEKNQGMCNKSAPKQRHSLESAGLQPVIKLQKLKNHLQSLLTPPRTNGTHKTSKRGKECNKEEKIQEIPVICVPGQLNDEKHAENSKSESKSFLCIRDKEVTKSPSSHLPVIKLHRIDHHDAGLIKAFQDDDALSHSRDPTTEQGLRARGSKRNSFPMCKASFVKLNRLPVLDPDA